MRLIPFHKLAPSLNIDRYREVRERVNDVQNRIVETLGKDALDACGRKLGLLSHRHLMLESESELAMLLDYCIFDYRTRDGRTAVQRYFRGQVAPAGHPDHALASAMLAATYRVVRIDRCTRKSAVEVTDLWTTAALTITDINLARCKAEGGILGIRTIDIDGMTISTGAMVPLWPETIAELFEMTDRRSGPRAARVEGDPLRDPAEFSATIIKAAIRSGSTAGVSFQDVS